MPATVIFNEFAQDENMPVFVVTKFIAGAVTDDAVGSDKTLLIADVLLQIEKREDYHQQ